MPRTLRRESEPSELHRYALRTQAIRARVSLALLPILLAAVAVVAGHCEAAPIRLLSRKSAAPLGSRLASDGRTPTATPAEPDGGEQQRSGPPAALGGEAVEPATSGNGPPEEEENRQGRQPADDGAIGSKSAPPRPVEGPSAKPTPSPQSPLRDSLVVSMWGNPDGLGVLGELTPEAAMQALRSLGARYQALIGRRSVVPAFFVVYATAQREPTDNGMYLRYLPDAAVWPYLTLAHENNGLLFLDLQLGLSDVRSQLERLRPYLLDPAVHVALDPEYAVRPGELPGEATGSLDGSDINAAQEYLQQLVEEHRLPDKIVVIHQFQDSVITNGDRVRHFPNVNVIVNMDAFGDGQQKVDKYQRFARRPYAEYASFNLFLKLDQGLLPAEEVVRLTPQPAMVIYQ